LPTASAAAISPPTPYDRIGGRAAIEAITERFYDLMEEEPGYARLRAMHAEDLGPMRRSLAGFLTGWSGGPRDWWIENPGKCMMSAHKPFAIDRELAGQWADAMRRAIADAGLADQDIAREMADVLERMTQGMINA
jgi:hemoglobin